MASPIRMMGLASNMDTESIVESLMSAQKYKKTKIENQITKLEWKQDQWKNLNTKIYSFYTDKLSKMRLQSSYATKKASSSNESIATVSAANSAPSGTHTLEVHKLASSQFVTGKQLATDDNTKAISTATKLTDLGMTIGNTISVTASGTTKTLEIKEESTVADFLSTLKSAGLNASYDTNQKRFFISSKESGVENAFSLTATNKAELSELGLDEIKNENGIVSVADSEVKVVAPSDASFTYNGTELTSKTNNVTVNGLSLILKAKTGVDEPISLTITNDTQAVYDMIKGFIKGYNEVLKEMNTNYHAEAARGFNPLSDTEKEAMSEDEIKKWETKIKDSLLRRDSTLGSLVDTMRTSMGKSVTVNGKSYSLSSFGIATSSDYTEKGLLHIDGDADNSLTSFKTDKLMEALNEDPDTVLQVFAQVAGDFYSKLTDSMSSTKLRSALTVYNDKEIKNTITDHKDELKKLEKKLQEIENRYYKQFTAMEKALSNLNSQSSSLMSMLGTGQN